MAKTKTSSKKQKHQQQRGVDFKKIKRKLGRKLPPPKNATNTEIKSKAIVLPEQSVASEKAGLAVNKKGLTTKELLQQTSHHNAKVRRDALLGMKDLFLTHPDELKGHKYAVMEKLRERFSDDDKIVRDTLYQLLKSIILPSCKEDNQEPLVSLMMAYVFNAMTHLAFDVRLMAFKFLDLVVQHYPPSFFLHAEKILQNYEDILLRNQLYLQDKAKLKNALAGLLRCLSLLAPDKGDMEASEKGAVERKLLHAYEPDEPRKSTEFSVITEKLQNLLPVLVSCFQDSFPVIHGVLPLDAQSFDCILSILQCIDLAVQFLQQLNEGYAMTMWCNSIAPLLLKKLLGVFPLTTPSLSEKDDDRYFILNIGITEIFMHIRECIHPPADILEKFLLFMEDALLGKSRNVMGSGKASREKHTLSLVHFIPRLLWQVVGDWKSRLVKAFTYTFQNCHPESSMKLTCLKAIGEMLFSREDAILFGVTNPELLDHWVGWIRTLPDLLIFLGNRVPSVSKVALDLLLCLGQRCVLNPVLEQEYDNLQYSIQPFYSTCQDDGTTCYGPFVKLPKDSQELSMSCLSYFSYLDSSLLTSITSCCLCHELDQLTLSRMIGEMESAYQGGRVQVADYVNFLITLVCRFKVFPETLISSRGIDLGISNRGTFKSIAQDVCSSLSRMGDNFLVLRMLEKFLLQEMSMKPPLDNACAMLKTLNKLDSAPSRLSSESVTTLSSFLLGYLIDVVHCIPFDDGEPDSWNACMQHYYILPCYTLLIRNNQLLDLVLSMMRSMMTKDTASGDVHRNTSGSSTVNALVSVLLWMHRDDKTQKLGTASNLSEKLCSFAE